MTQNYKKKEYEKKDLPKLLWGSVNLLAKFPTKRKEDNGYDLYGCFPDDFEVKLLPGDILEVHTGLICAYPKEYQATIKERGSTGKIGLKVNAGEIDSGFRGEWIILLNNTSNGGIIITKDIEKHNRQARMYPNRRNIIYDANKAIAQVKFTIKPEFQELDNFVEDNEMIYSISSDRNNGKYGSSGK